MKATSVKIKKSTFYHPACENFFETRPRYFGTTKKMLNPPSWTEFFHFKDDLTERHYTDLNCPTVLSNIQYRVNSTLTSICKPSKIMTLRKSGIL